MRLSPDELRERARNAEAAGFSGVAGMDHMAPPMATQHAMYEALTTCLWWAVHTEVLRVSPLVLCDTFRHPALLAQQAVSLDHFSGGRFDLGIGTGSVADELGMFGVWHKEDGRRIARLSETLDIVKALWTGERIDYDGEFFQLRDAQQGAVPLDHIPILIGGAGPKTMELVAKHADWWNVHVGILDKLDERRELAGDAKPSLQLRIAYVHDPAKRSEVEEITTRRFGTVGVIIGEAQELIDHFGDLADKGVERTYAWFTDFATPDTLAAFGEDVIPALR